MGITSAEGQAPCREDLADGIIRTPTVRSQVRAHFDCPTAEGAPLENQGGAGTASSHWEETAFFSEVPAPRLARHLFYLPIRQTVLTNREQC